MSSDRLVIPNMIILSKKRYLEKKFLHNNIDGNDIMAVSDIGYNNDELSLHWFEYFNKNT